jgi:NAD(P)-dependent dehydrogenase (short-subunit alcohol dehydrogenase family)
MKLDGKVALVTGGGRGIGRGCAHALAQAGADVSINYVSAPDEATSLVKELQTLGRRAIAVQGDVSRAADATRMVAETVQGLGRLDVLVNNAGVLSFEPFLEMRESTWDHVMAVNLKGTFLVAQAAARAMAAAKTSGRIINMASIASGGVGIGFPGVAHYTASKGGIVAMTETMAIELGPLGITVNAVAPGVIDTDMTKGMLSDEPARKTMLARIPVGRVGRPNDVAAVVAFLASDEAAYCSGSVFYVDGGWLAG